MSAFFIFPIAVLVVFIFYPQLNESASGPCHALEKRVISGQSLLAQTGRGNWAGNAFLGAFATDLTNGSVASVLVKSYHPNVPPQIGCSFIYWQVMAKPELAHQLAKASGLTR